MEDEEKKEEREKVEFEINLINNKTKSNPMRKEVKRGGETVRRGGRVK